MRGLKITILAMTMTLAGFATDAALVLDVNPNQDGDWVLHLTGSHDGSGMDYYNDINQDTEWNQAQDGGGGSGGSYVADNVEDFSVSGHINRNIINAFDVGDGTVVGDTNLKGIAVTSNRIYLKLVSSFATPALLGTPATDVPEFTSAIFDETLVLKPSAKDSFAVVWIEGTYINITEDFTLNVSNVVVPEPSTITLMSLSTISLFFTRSIRRRKQAGRSLFPIRTEYYCDTFCTLDEWEDTCCEIEEEDCLAEVEQMAKAWLVDAWSTVHAGYKTVDRAFWNKMVIRNERRIVRRKAFKKALKTTALNYFDAFLAAIMK